MSKRVRVKFGKNPYAQEFTCAHCRKPFTHGGLLLRVDFESHIVDVPICPACNEGADLFEGLLDVTRHNRSHPIGLA